MIEVEDAQPARLKASTRLYLFFHSIALDIAGFYKRHWLVATFVSLFLLFVMFITRALYHPYVVEVRRLSFLVVPAMLLVVIWVWARKQTTFKKVVTSLLVLCGFVALFLWGGAAHDYVALYYRYKTLNVVELQQLPITGHERLQPLNSIYSLAHEKASSEMESPQRPDWVRVNDEYRWTLAIEPAHLIPRLTGKVKELVAATDASPDFSKREHVDFAVGESMLLSRNSHTATIKSFGLWRYFNYEPAEARYIKDDRGKWVQVVSLIRWTGIVFPRPEFGGVQLVRQEDESNSNSLKLMLFGIGEWVRPEDINKFSYLVGQNIVPYEVSRYIANSFRFQNGFFGPMPWNHQGDVRIPDLPADVNDQPFTTYFEQVVDRPGMLYHYFALEPYDVNKQGLSVSLLIPADRSRNVVYTYKHTNHEGESLTGVSAIAAKVMDSQKTYDWSRHRPVEHRPFIRDIDGARRFFWLTTVVTMKEGTTGKSETGEEVTIKGDGPQWFIAGALPNIVITDADRNNLPVWVSLDTSKWVEEIKAEEIKQGRKE